MLAYTSMIFERFDDSPDMVDMAGGDNLGPEQAPFVLCHTTTVLAFATKPPKLPGLNAWTRSDSLSVFSF